MRNRPIKSKLRSRRGASLTLALMLLLVTSMVAAVVLASAVTTAKRVRSRKDTQQSLLTLQSAVTTIRDQFPASEAEITETRQGDGLPSISVRFTSGPLSDAEHPLAEKAKKALREAYEPNVYGISNESPAVLDPNGFTVRSQVGEEALQDVNVYITMLGNNHDSEEGYMDFQIELLCSVNGGEEQLDLKLDTDVHNTTIRQNGVVVMRQKTITWRPEGEA